MIKITIISQNISVPAIEFLIKLKNLFLFNGCAKKKRAMTINKCVVEKQMSFAFRYKMKLSHLAYLIYD